MAVKKAFNVEVLENGHLLSSKNGKRAFLTIDNMGEELANNIHEFCVNEFLKPANSNPGDTFSIEIIITPVKKSNKPAF